MIYIAVPFAAIGGIFSLYLRDMPFSISAGVGFIVLFGVAVLNGLVLISGFNELKAEGKYHINEIIKRGSIRRIRPIILTASTDILGFLPMAVSASAGAEVQRPLATVVIGGMLTSTLLTLIVLPILYRFVESGTKKIKLPKQGTVVAAFLIFITGIGFSGNTTAQDSTLTLQQAIERAKESYPSIKAAQMEVDKQKALKSTAYELGSTSIYTGKEEVGSGFSGVHNKIGIEQTDIDVFSIPAKSKLAKVRTQQAESGQILTEYALIRDVSISWYRAAYAKQQWLLFVQLDTLYSDFEKAAELRFQTKQTSKIEYLSASAKYNELQVNIKNAESNYLAGLQILNQYLLYPTLVDVDIQSINQQSGDPIEQSDSLVESPLLNYYSTGIDVAESAWKSERSKFLPKLNLGYKSQSVDGNSGFYGWEAGISVPLLFFSQSGKTKAANLDYQIAGQKFEQKQLEVHSGYNQMISRYFMLKQVIDYYQNEALPLAEEQIQATNLAYKLGSIDYVQFIQNLESAITTKQDFLKQQAEYLELSAQLKYITGK
jgi:cobalt-zinc-cadmium resistance protein CzcA